MKDEPYFSTREYVFAAMMAAGKLVTSSILVPLTLGLRIPGLTNVIIGPFASFFLVLGLIRLRKPGSLLLITGLYSLTCLPIHLLIFLFVITGGVFAELVCTTVFRGYETRLAQGAGAVLYQMAIWPAAMFFSYLLMPETFKAFPIWVWPVAEIAIAISALVGTLVAFRVAKELVKAGKLRVEESE